MEKPRAVLVIQWLVFRGYLSAVMAVGKLVDVPISLPKIRGIPDASEFARNPAKVVDIPILSLPQEFSFHTRKYLGVAGNYDLCSFVRFSPD